MRTKIFLVVMLSLTACKKKGSQTAAEADPGAASGYAERQSKLTYHRIDNACVVLFADYSFNGFALTSVPCP